MRALREHNPSLTGQFGARPDNPGSSRASRSISNNVGGLGSLRGVRTSIYMTLLIFFRSLYIPENSLSLDTEPSPPGIDQMDRDGTGLTGMDPN